MRAQLLVLGKSSFLAQHVLAALPAGVARAVRHTALAEPDLLDGIRTVISFAKHPGLGRSDHALEDDPDVRLAQRVGDRPIRHLMLSSRKVYAPAAHPLREIDPLEPSDAYGRNKLRLERRLADLLGERLTILRLANIFGYERGRQQFLGLLLDRLAREGAVHYDISPFVQRDFLPVERAGAILAQLALAPPGGVLNVGSGIGLPVGRLALWILEGFGRGRLVINDPREHDGFVLDVRRLEGRLGPTIRTGDLEASCRAIGRRLKEETDP